MMNHPLVSIIIPVYNGANYMREAIDSALGQTYDHCEIIVINDGSTDHTEEIALSYGDKLRYFHKENGGVSTALNMGIEHMRGEYFSWLSHDDRYYPDKIEKQINALRLCGDMTRIAWGDYDRLNEFIGQIECRRFSEMDDITLLTDSIYPVIKSYIGGCSLLIHESHFKRVGDFNPDLRYTQDYDMWFRMMRGQRTVYIHSPLYQLRDHGERGTRAETVKMRPDEAALWLGFTLAVTREEAERMFENFYAFYLYMYHKMISYGVADAIQAVYDRLMAQPVPSGISARIHTIKKNFQGITGGKTDRLCIFCAGRYAARLYYTLKAFHISVDFFADNDAAKHGAAVLDGIKCLSVEDLMEMRSHVLIIVANREPNEIARQLLGAGFPFVMTKQELDEWL